MYVGNISFQSSKEDLGEYFGQYGEVKDVFIPVNKFGDSRGFCFITVKDEDVETVIEATNGGEFMGRPLAVNHPLPPGEKPQKRGAWLCIFPSLSHCLETSCRSNLILFDRKTRTNEDFHR